MYSYNPGSRKGRLAGYVGCLGVYFALQSMNISMPGQLSATADDHQADTSKVAQMLLLKVIGHTFKATSLIYHLTINHAAGILISQSFICMPPHMLLIF